MLTGKHVGSGSLTLRGDASAAETGTDVHSTSPVGSGLSGNTHLLMSQLEMGPLLPLLAISSSTPWAETAEVGSDQEGFKSDSTSSMRWSENTIGVLTKFGAGYGDLLSLVTVFDEAGETHEVQAVIGAP